MRDTSPISSPNRVKGILYVPAERYGTFNVEVQRRGIMVRALVQGEANPGTYTAMWNAADTKGRRAAAGVYLVKLTPDGSAGTHKLVVRRQVRIKF